MTTFLEAPTRFLFFTGKGGVGKTALACATALRLADGGRRVLLVSTDPASNLGEMLGTPLSNQPRPVGGVDGLSALDIDPERAAEAYRARVVAPYVVLWSEERIATLREELAGACTTEIAAFDAFAELLADGPDHVAYDHVIFDTAPTGHTLRLLSLPRAWTGFLQSAHGGASCLGPHVGLKAQERNFASAMKTLGDASRTTVVLVSRPNRAALREADRAAGELLALGITHLALALNATFTATLRDDPIALAFEARSEEAMRTLPQRLRALPTVRVPLRAFDMVGLRALRALLDDGAAAALGHDAVISKPPTLPALGALVDELERPGRGLVLVMGKGGVGKTTMAAAIAAELASRGHDVHLSTTDPAAHVASTLDGQVPHLSVSRIDPEAETKAYVARVMATRGAKLDAAGRALLAEDLRSPCYEEVAVFAAFARLVSQARKSFVVLDTAPTGHTLLLLDATGSYHRQVLGDDVVLGEVEGAGRLVTPLMRLRDPGYTRVLIVTLAETTPVAEAARLQADLQRARIEPFAWIVNATLAGSGVREPVLVQRTAGELAQIEIVRARHAARLAVVPWTPEEPVGVARLTALARTPQPRAAEARDAPDAPDAHDATGYATYE